MSNGLKQTEGQPQQLFYDPATKGYSVREPVNGNFQWGPGGLTQQYEYKPFNGSALFQQGAPPPATNYSPTAQYLAQLAEAQNPQSGGLLGPQPTRVAPKLSSKQAPTQNAAALAAQYLK